ncbi:MAG: hypothetical protein Ct9H300mP4_04740 [Gammaproteobacteria bacterium]|nr:MAG: hypothetical protein Ct9H300mP4_04740 [Gammaproteobacteria bacterium]
MYVRGSRFLLSFFTGVEMGFPLKTYRKSNQNEEIIISFFNDLNFARQGLYRLGNVQIARHPFFQTWV